MTNGPTNQQHVATDQPTCPTQERWYRSSYLSVRITLAHKHVDDIKNLFREFDWCIYMHKPGDVNEHFHVCLPDAKPEAIRNRIKRCWDTTGNKFYCITSYKNGLRSFVFYCHHEGAAPIFKQADTWTPIIEDVTKHGAYKKPNKVSSGAVEKVRERLSNPQLTMSNLLRQSVKFAKEQNIVTTDIGVVCRRMVDAGWDPDYGLISKGVPTEYYEIFAKRMTDQKCEDMDWMKPHKRKERLGDVPEIDTDYQHVHRTNKLKPMV